MPGIDRGMFLPRDIYLGLRATAQKMRASMRSTDHALQRHRYVETIPQEIRLWFHVRPFGLHDNSFPSHFFLNTAHAR